MVFDPRKYLIKVQGNRQYLPVAARLVWFREEHPDWGIETEPLAIDNEKQYAIFRCRIFNAEGKLMAMGTKKEDVKGFGDYVEKSETGSVGRALAMCGYGTQFAPDLDELPPANNAPRQFQQSGQGPQQHNNAQPRRDAPPAPPPQSAPKATPDGPPSCVNCGKALTKGQQELSIRNYGEALCPTCQKDKTRVPRSAPAAQREDEDDFESQVGNVSPASHRN